VERFGGYYATWDVGIHFLIPFIDRIAKQISFKESLFDYDPQPVITKDNVTLEVDTVVFYQIADAKLYTYGAENPKLAIEKLTLTTLRNVIGELELDDTLTSRDTINGKLRTILDDATDPWGIKVNRVEVKNIEPPATVKEAMEKQMRAEREKRATVLSAEGEKEAAILKAGGEKQAAIFQAEGEKQAMILRAEGKKEVAIREAEGQAEAILAVQQANAEAQKQVIIKEAEGQAAAIVSVQRATAEGLALIKNAVGAEGAIKLKSFETFEKVADGKATKIIIPSDMQNLAGLVAGVSEIAGKTAE
jgi:regulator of protease activity HflC (stomatin/prohibitin superfamily)